MNLDHADFQIRQLSAVPVRGTTVLRPVDDIAQRYGMRPLKDMSSLSPAQQVSNMCWRYFGIIEIEEEDPQRMIHVPIGEIDIALHAAFVAGMRHATTTKKETT